MKKSSILLLTLCFWGLLLPLTNLADDDCPDKLVPCGGPDCPCTLCHLFLLLNNVLDFVIFTIIPPVAGLMLIIGGIWFYFSGASPEQKRRAQAIVTSSIIGIVIILSAWIVVNTILSGTGIVEMGGWKWYEIECPVD